MLQKNEFCSENEIQADFYLVVHHIPGRMRLRPSLQETDLDRASLLGIMGKLSSAAIVKVAETGSILIIGSDVFCDAINAVVKPAPLGDGHNTAKNPVPGKLLSYVYPRFLRSFLSFAHAMPYLLRGVRSFVRNRSLNLDVLDASALVVCLLRRDYKALGSIVFFFALGEYLAEWTRKKSHASLAESLALNIEDVWMLSDGVELQVPLSSVMEGDTVVVRAGSIIPVDGTVSSGTGMVNQSSMTGEALAVQRSAGNSVYAGTVLEEGEIHIKTLKIGGETRIHSILRYIEESEEAKAGIQGRYERIADSIVPYNFMLAGLVYALTRSPMRAGSVLLVDYSCAIRLSTPLVILTAMQEAAEHGVLIKGGKFAEALAHADAVVFDKTGTLTEAQPTVVAVIPFGEYKREFVLKTAACLEEHFPHPVGRAVVRAAKEENLSHNEEHAEVEFVVAHGVASRLYGKRVLVGSEHFLIEDSKVHITQEQREIVRREAEKGRSVLYLSIDGDLAGVLLIEDKIRHNAFSVINALKADGVKRVIMLTGDGQLTAASIAGQAGISEYKSCLLPEEKATYIAELRAEGYTVLMLGDGINDSPALSAANVGVAMCSGADMAKEVADIVLTSGDLADLLIARKISQRALKRIGKNFNTSLFWNSIFLLGGLGGFLSAGFSAFLHNATTSAIAVSSMHPLLPEQPPHHARATHDIHTGEQPGDQPYDMAKLESAN